MLNLNTKLTYELPDDPPPNYSFENSTLVTESDVQKVLMHFKPKSWCGIEEMSMKLNKACSEEIIKVSPTFKKKPLIDIINLTLPCCLGPFPKMEGFSQAHP